MDKSNHIVVLLKKYIEESLSPEEEARLNSWADKSLTNRKLLNRISKGNMIWEDALKWIELEKSDQEGWEERLDRKTFSKVNSARLSSSQRPKRKFNILLYAAMVSLFLTGGLLYYTQFFDLFEETPQVVQDIAPVNGHPTLTLADGRVIALNNDKQGVVLGDELTYNDGTVIGVQPRDELTTAILTTPKGGMYQLTLSDGTRVWLNAASKLTYPIQFSTKQRVVKLEGEAYFEVSTRYQTNSKDNSMEKLPFLVETSNQVIEVLGTEFNVMAYPDESTTKTTLVEGAVMLKSNQNIVRLTPGEQGVLENSALSVVQVDVNQHTAWKNNKFVFYETELQSAMKDLSRWYDLEIIYEGEVPQTYFYGEISREYGLAEVLKTLRIGGIKFRMEKMGDKNRLIVYP